MDPSPKSPNNKFVESGRRSQSESRIKILVYSVKRKDLYAYICRKYHRTCPSTRTKITEFFIFTVVFFQPFRSLSLFSFLSFFFVSLSFYPFSYYIPWFLHHFPHLRVGQVVRVIFLCPPLPLLKPSTLSCKAARSLFRHHLHINVARELIGQHLMRG